MKPTRFMTLVLACSAFTMAAVQGGEPVGAPAAAIDTRLAKTWRAGGVEPAPRVDDATYLRRVYLDLAGRVPSVMEVRQFLATTDADKRARIVDHLLASPDFLRHWSRVLKSAWLPLGAVPVDDELQSQFETWLQDALRQGRPYDELVRGVITTHPESPRNPRAGQPQPSAFFEANDGKPEMFAASVSRIFLGQTLECAQCHKHPFAAWSQEQFWSFAAFFVPPRSQEMPRIAIPGGKDTAVPRHLDGQPLASKAMESPREELAKWVTDPANPFFTTNAVSQLWAHFLGEGLLPSADSKETAASQHAALLEELARSFVASGYDLKAMIRTILASQAYQADSRATGQTPDPLLFTHFKVRRLTPDQLFDSIALATGYVERPGTRAFAAGQAPARKAFLARFGTPEPATSVLQSLQLMNGATVSQATDVRKGRTLAALDDGPFATDQDRINALFLATLSRFPNADEAAAFAGHLAKASDAEGRREALADLLWALLNATEFTTNH